MRENCLFKIMNNIDDFTILSNKNLLKSFAARYQTTTLIFYHQFEIVKFNAIDISNLNINFVFRE